MFHCKHLEPIHVGVEDGALGSSKTYAQVFVGHSGAWFEIYWR